MWVGGVDRGHVSCHVAAATHIWNPFVAIWVIRPTPNTGRRGPRGHTRGASGATTARLSPGLAPTTGACVSSFGCIEKAHHLAPYKLSAPLHPKLALCPLYPISIDRRPVIWSAGAFPQGGRGDGAGGGGQLEGVARTEVAAVRLR